MTINLSKMKCESVILTDWMNELLSPLRYTILLVELIGILNVQENWLLLAVIIGKFEIVILT